MISHAIKSDRGDITDIIKKFSDEYSRYLCDESRTMGHADYIAFPSNETELSGVVKYCNANNVLINTQGGLTGLAGGASPLGGLILNLSRMNRILGMRREDDRFFLRVQPGVLLIDVRKALLNKSFDITGWDEESIETLRGIKAGELFFSPDPTEPTASLGGMASCNACGARSFLYGCTRSHINALHVILSDGTVLNLKRGVDKCDGRNFSFNASSGVINANLPDFDTPDIKNAGYYFRPDMDLVDLFIGSQGTLGVISELELCLMPAPELMWGVTAFLPDDESALRYVKCLKTDFIEKPASIEFFNKFSLDMVQLQKAETPAFAKLQELPEGYSCAVYSEFNKTKSENFYTTVESLSNLITSVGGDPDNTWLAKDADELEKLLFFRHTVPETIDILIEKNRKNEPKITILSTDMAVDDEHFDELFHIYKNDLEKTDLFWIIFGHIGENHVHPNIIPRNYDEYMQGHAIFEKWAHDVYRLGGTISAEHGAGKIKRNLAMIMYGEDKMRQLLKLKHSLDPKGLMSPGNILTEVD